MDNRSICKGYYVCKERIEVNEYAIEKETLWRQTKPAFGTDNIRLEKITPDNQWCSVIEVTPKFLLEHFEPAKGVI